jgi:uncharacterized protein
MTTLFDAQILLLAKVPHPGSVKTRLCPPYTHAQAAMLAAAALRDTMRAVTTSRADSRVLVIDGLANADLCWGFEVIRQRGDGLDERIAAAFDDGFALHPSPQLLIGMDTPHLTSALLDATLAALTAPDVDAVIGPTDDGGYWAIGLRVPNPAAIIGVPMSVGETFSSQLARLRGMRLRVEILPRLRDVDYPDDAAAVAEIAPHTQFAATLRGINPAPAAS